MRPVETLRPARARRRQKAGPTPPVDPPPGAPGDDPPAVPATATTSPPPCLTGRRRLVNPTASESDFSSAEAEFMGAMQEYKRRSGRMFPTWSEVLEVLQGLGYEKVAMPAIDPGPLRANPGGAS